MSDDLKLTFSTETPEAEIPFWVFCEGVDCKGQSVLMETLSGKNPLKIFLPLNPVMASQTQVGSEVIVQHAGPVKFTLGEHTKTLDLKPHSVLSFGEEFVWVFSAIVIVVSAIFIYMKRKDQK
jgi:hypothetical protein